MIWVLKHQTEEGSFYDVSWFPDRKVNSTLNRSFSNGFNRRQRFSNISLTAQVLITLASAKDLSGVSFYAYIVVLFNLINIYFYDRDWVQKYLKVKVEL